MQEKVEQQKTGKRALLLLILSLAWPTMLEQLLQTAVQYVDTAMVGSLGTDATAAVGATTTVNWLVGSTVSAVGVGFLAFISQALGMGEARKARQASAQSVLAVLVVGGAATVLTMGLSPFIPTWMQADAGVRKEASLYFLIFYSTMLFRTANIIFGTVLRAAGDTKTPMFVGLGVNVINVFLNYFLIYPTRTVVWFGNSFEMAGAGWGTAGAAAASAISYAVGGALVTFALWRHKTVSFRGESIKPDPLILKPCLCVAFPNVLQRFATSFGYVAFAAMINALGKVPTAAHTVANTVESLFYVPGWGMQTASATIAGNAWGAQDEEKLKLLTRMTTAVEVLLMLLSGGALLAFARPLVMIFSKDEEVIALGTTVLRMVALSEPFYGVAIVLEGMMQGVGNTKLPFVFNVAGMWGVRILGTFLFTAVMHYGLVTAWGCMIAHNVTLFLLFVCVFATGKWKPKVAQKT